MKEHYKVLGGILALGDFTVGDLVRMSGVKEATVRTVLQREANLYEAVGEEPSNGPGGRFRRLRLKPDRRDELRSRLVDLYRELGAAVIHPESNAGVPEALLVAEDLLVRKLPAQKVAQRPATLQLAEVAERAGQREISAILSQDSNPRHRALLEGHLAVLRRLQIWAKQLVEVHDAVSGSAPARIRSEALAIAHDLATLGEDSHAAELLRYAGATGESRNAGRYEEIVFLNQNGIENEERFAFAAFGINRGVRERLRKVLSTIDRGEVKDIEGRAIDRWPTAERYYLLVDSKIDECKELALAASIRYGDRVLVLDSDFDEDVRREVYKGQANYLDHVVTLGPNELRVALRCFQGPARRSR